MESTKGNMVSLQTFQTYETNNVIGYKTINIEGKIMVNFAWYKLCAKHKIQFTTIQNVKEMLKNLLKFTLEGQITSPNGALADI